MEIAQELFQRGIDLQQRGLFDHAIEEYEKALEIEPENVDIMLNLGAAFLQKGLSNKAIKILSKVLQYDSRNTLALFNMGKAFIYRDDPETALEAFQRAEQLAPDDIDIKKSIVNCYKLLGKFTDAVELTKSFLEDIETSFSDLMEFAESLLSVGDYTEALEIYRKASDLVCDSIDALLGVYKCQYRLGSKDKAVTTLRRALMIEPFNQDLYIKLVDILIEMGHLQEALEIINRGLDTAPDIEDLQDKYNELVRRLPILKKRSEAGLLKVKDSIYELEIYDILDNLYDGKIKYDAAIKELEAIRQKDPEDIFVAEELANLFFQARMFDQASEIYSQILANRPHEIKYIIDIVKTLVMKGDLLAARAILIDSLRKKGDLLELNLAMVEIDLYEKDFKQAFTKLDSITKKFPEDSHTMFLKGYTAMRLDNLDVAEESFKNLFRKSYVDEELVLWYSRLCIMQGHPEKALPKWDAFSDGIKSLVEIVCRVELLLASGESTKIMETLRAIGEYHPRFIEDHLLFGKAFFFAGDFASAQREFDIVLKQESKNSEALAMSAINSLIRGKSSKFWRFWQYALDSDSLFAVLPVLILKKSFNFSQLERVKGETKKMLAIASLKEEDRSRLTRLLRTLQ